MLTEDPDLSPFVPQPPCLGCLFAPAPVQLSARQACCSEPLHRALKLQGPHAGLKPVNDCCKARSIIGNITRTAASSPQHIWLAYQQAFLVTANGGPQQALAPQVTA